MNLDKAKSYWLDFSGKEKIKEKQSVEFSFKTIEKGNPNLFSFDNG